MEVTNDVLFEKIMNLSETNHESHAQINKQLEQLNGSVVKLKTWRSFITGGLAVITAIVVPIALMVFAYYLESQ